MRWVTGTFIMLVTALPGGAQAPPAKKKLPDYYPLGPGTKWTYELDPGNGRKILVANQIARLETIDGKAMARLETVINGRVMTTAHLLGTREGVSRHRMSEAEVSPPVCFLKYPFREGESWEAEPKVGLQQMKMSFKSGRNEELTLPAGKYQAVSVVFEMNVNGAPFKSTSWYAADVGMVKQITEIGDQTITMGLVRFESGK